MENTQRVSFLGQEPHTLLEDAVRATLWLPAARSPKPEARSPKPKAQSPKPTAGGVFVSPNRLQRRAAFPEH
ncbi:hypothetical protein [Pantoea ananatis]|uniref:hypothetical protein n=2 Tax=Pantoea ananas TaxID=553 RepID=UPI001FF0C1AC|nr:hypothetical protein [Pantoea ananatis]